MRVVGIAFDVGEQRIEPRIHRFQSAQDVERLALLRHAQALEGVVAGRLLAGEVEDVLRAGQSAPDRSPLRPSACAGPPAGGRIRLSGKRSRRPAAPSSMRRPVWKFDIALAPSLGAGADEPRPAVRRCIAMPRFDASCSVFSLCPIRAFQYNLASCSMANDRRRTFHLVLERSLQYNLATRLRKRHDDESAPTCFRVARAGVSCGRRDRSAADLQAEACRAAHALSGADLRRHRPRHLQVERSRSELSGDRQRRAVAGRHPVRARRR